MKSPLTTSLCKQTPISKGDNIYDRLKIKTYIYETVYFIPNRYLEKQNFKSLLRNI